ncbi:hypothetical protein [Mesorhizobium sp. BR1-1-4]|uniref:hypothetical protein n=1 Tax=Mesorhizobium sp. BR1-1-4 TaxID=2876650 RepID=UPI001CCDE56D|nr:hypothetical protein [Mesorhizobium sp. BR1-1-4]MBZ9680192.1 hypothetical protein [Mesorhizobium sp. CO1-1-2]MBZ9927928.1 hypothetical protein [Mesorhizobium sp. BR1-1-4]
MSAYAALSRQKRAAETGARLVVAHHSVPNGTAKRWLARSSAFADRAGVDRGKAAAWAEMAGRLPLLSGAEEDLLCEAGFSDVELLLCRLLVPWLSGDGKHGLSASRNSCPNMAKLCSDFEGWCP